MADEQTLLTRGAAPVEDTAVPAEQAQTEQAPEQKATPTASEDWRPESLRGEKALEKYKSPEDAYKALIEAQKLIGKKADPLAPPAEDAPQEEKDAFSAKLRELRGIPTEDKVAEAYAVAVPEGAPEGYAINPEFLERFQQRAFKAGMAPAEFRDLAQGYIEDEIAAMQAAHEAGVRQAKENEEALVKAWRDEGHVPGEMFKAANTAVDALGLRDIVEAPANSPAFIKAMAEKVYPLIAEGKLKGGATASINEPKMTEKEAMDKGRAMMRDPRWAGNDPGYVAEVRAHFARHFPGEHTAASRVALG